MNPKKRMEGDGKATALTADRGGEQQQH